MLAKESLTKPAPPSEIPIHYLALLDIFGMHEVPDTDFTDTNLADAMGRKIKDLSPSLIEKLILLAAGFQRHPEIVRAERFIVGKNGTGKSLYSERTLHTYLEEHLEADRLVGIRIRRNNKNGQSSASAPFVLARGYQDYRLLWSLNKEVIGFTSSLEEPDYQLFNPGDTIEVFPSPKSPKALITGFDRHEPTEPIPMGGGFDCQLTRFNPDSGTFILTFQFVFGYTNPRDINRSPVPHITTIVEVNPSPKGFQLISPPIDPNKDYPLNTAKKLATLFAESFITTNALPLQRLLTSMLTLTPKEGFHAVDGLFATITDQYGQLTPITTLFDIESSEHSQKWQPNRPSKQPYNPFLQAPKLITLLSNHQVAPSKLDPADNILLKQLQRSEILTAPTPEEIIQGFTDLTAHANRTRGQRIRRICESPIVSSIPDLPDIIRSHASRTHRFTQDLTIPAALGRLLAKLPVDWQSPHKHIYIHKNGDHQVILLDIDGYYLGFITGENQLQSLYIPRKSAIQTLTHHKNDILNILGIKDHHLYTQAIINSTKEGD